MYPPREFRIQQRQLSDDEIGGVEEAWSDYMSVEGYIDLQNGSDLPSGSLNNAWVEESTHILVIPEMPADIIDDSMRVVGGDRWYDITYVDNPVGIDHHLELYLRYGGVVND